MRKYIYHFLFVVVILNSFIIFSSCAFFTKMDYEDAQKQLAKNKTELTIVCEYLIDSGYENTTIYTRKPYTMIADTQDVKIEQANVVEAIKKIKSSGFGTVGMNDNTIYFQRNSPFDDQRGIAFSKDEYQPHGIEYKTAMKQLEGKWYYYEADYNAWRNGKRGE